MNTRSLRVGLLLFLHVCFLASLFGSVSLLPERVATHFNAVGQPDGWMTRSTHLLFMGTFGLLFPLFMIGIFWATRFLPASLINIPNRDYWLADERKAASVSYLMWHAIWFGCLMQSFMIGLHWLIVFSNQQQPTSMPMSWGLGVLVPFLLGVAAWVYCLHRRFSRGGSDQSGGIESLPAPTPA